MQTPRRLARVVLCLAATSLLASCRMAEESPWLYRHADAQEAYDDDYVEGEPITEDDFDAIWERSRQVLSGEGLIVDEDRTSYADRLLVTRWATFLAPNRFEGYRTRIWIRFGSKDAGKWTTGVAAQKQRNEDINRPSEASVARWAAQPADKARAGVILWKIEAAFRAPQQD